MSAVEVELADAPADDVLLRFTVYGADRLVIAKARAAARTDGLWRTTCFECFARQVGSEAYEEYNFSPSGDWAAYMFDAYRAGMRELPIGVLPDIRRDDEGPVGSYVFNVLLSRWNMPEPPLQLGLSAVIEEQGGRKSYWALAHPPGAPDFHHSDCFTLELPASRRP